MFVHCELHLYNINGLDIPEEVHLIRISYSMDYSNYMSWNPRHPHLSGHQGLMSYCMPQHYEPTLMGSINMSLHNQ